MSKLEKIKKIISEHKEFLSKEYNVKSIIALKPLIKKTY